VVRVVPALIGLGLAVMWVIGVSVEATIWLTWTVGIAAALSLATVGIIPERRGSAWAGLCLGAITAGLVVMWIVGLETQATGWLVWWTFVGACLTAVAALSAAAQGAIDAIRAPDVI
jgi:hypothetical protein